jgi:hypothetical protein
MGLLDRLLGTKSFKSSPDAAKPAAKAQEAMFLDADESSSLGNVDFMRRTNEIRRTFPGTADNPGLKERVDVVASMEARVERLTDGMPGTEAKDTGVDLTGGIPKAVKKTFAQTMTADELSQRLKGSAIGGVNVPGVAATGRKASSDADQPEISRQGARPGAIDGFKGMAKDITG